MEQSHLQSVRKRARKACESCRKRKRRCDGSQPCRACIEFEYDCQYADQSLLSVPLGGQSRSTTARGRSPGMKDINSVCRILAQGSLVLFPQMVAETIYARFVPVRHDFGYNLGMPALVAVQDTRPDSIKSAMSHQKIGAFCNRYMESCNVIFPVFDREELKAGLRTVMTSGQLSPTTSVVEVAVTFVVLLGSYFSWPNLADKHDALLKHAEEELETLTFRRSSSDNKWLLRAWVLRTLLVRSSSTPDLAWLSSCTMMHVAELTQDVSQSQNSASQESKSVSGSQVDSDLLDLAWTLDQFISLESGRSASILSPWSNSEDESTERLTFIRLRGTFQQISDVDARTSFADIKMCIFDLCHRHTSTDKVQDPRIILLEACVLCGLYRLIFKQASCLEQSVVSTMKTFLLSALTAADALLEDEEAWFMLAAFTSQLLCVCLALERSLLGLLAPTLSLLSKTARKFGSDILKETERNAYSFTETCMNSREEDISSLRKSLKFLSVERESAMSGVEDEEEEWTYFLNRQVLD